MADVGAKSDELLPAGPSAALLGVHKATLARYEDRGLIKSVRTPSGHRRYRRGDVEALLTEAAS